MVTLNIPKEVFNLYCKKVSEKTPNLNKELHVLATRNLIVKTVENYITIRGL